MRIVRSCALLAGVSLLAVLPVTPARAAASPGVVSIGDVRVYEGDFVYPGPSHVAILPVTLAGPLPTDETVAYSVTGGTATPGPYSRAGLRAGADYKTRSGTLLFRRGNVAKYVMIKIFGDGDVEGDETIEITLTSPSSGLTLGKAVGIITIDESDGLENPIYRGETPEDNVTGVYVNNVSVVEGDNNVRVVKFSITASRWCDDEVNWQLVAGTATGGWKGGKVAPAGVDFADRLGLKGTVNLRSGNKGGVQKNIAVKIAPDTVPEEAEQFSVVLSTGPNFSCTNRAAAIGPPGIGTILDDD